MTELARHRSRPLPFRAHELALMSLGVVTLLALFAVSRSFKAVSMEVGGATILYAVTIYACLGRPGRLSPKIRFLVSFAFVLWYYCAIARITPALGTTLRDGVLLAIDERMFGQTPAVLCRRFYVGWVTDLMGLCYLSYHLYLGLVVVQVVWVAHFEDDHLGPYLFMGFALGFVGYLVVPAVGPGIAYPNLFLQPLPGGPIWRLIGTVVARGSSMYDVFPSLHIMITCMLLDHDWRHVRKRFWLMLAPSIGLLVSTIYLRYHYGVDVLAGFLLFLVLRQTFLKAVPRKATIAE